MSLRKARFILLAVAAAGCIYQLGGCVGQTIIQLAGVTFLDLFLSPLVGDTCTLFNSTGC